MRIHLKKMSGLKYAILWQSGYVKLLLLSLLGMIAAGCSETQVAPYGIRCTEVGTAYNNGIYTKVSGLPFNLDVVLTNNGTPATVTASDLSKVKSVTLALVDTASMSCESASVVQSTSVQLAKSGYDLNRGYASSIQVLNPYRSLTCRATIVAADNSSYTKCDSSSFSVRPAFLSVRTSTTNAENDPTGTLTSGTKIVKASSAGASGCTDCLIGLEVRAYNAVGSQVSLSSLPKIDNTLVAAHAGAIATGTVYPSSFPVVSGNVASGNFTYSEVGYFKFQTITSGSETVSAIYDDSYDSSGCIAGKSSNVLVGGKYGCRVGLGKVTLGVLNSTGSDFFGRFVPYTFQTQPVTSGTTQSCTAGANPFTYFGSEFSTIFQINALAEGGGVTRNYDGGFAKFAFNSAGTTYANYNFALSPVLSGVTLQQGSQSPQYYNNATWASGTAQIKAFHKASRVNTAITPQSFSVTAKPTDGDVQSPTATTLTSTPVAMRYGRLKFYNAYGAETMPLRVKAYAQYWDGSKWVLNTDDSCSVLSADNIYLKFPADPRNHLSQCEIILSPVSGTSTFNKGIGTYQFSAPGQGNNGWLEMSVRYTLTGALDELFCSLAGVPTPLLVSGLTQFLDTLLGNDSVKATVSFGQYKSSTIYNRER